MRDQRLSWTIVGAAALLASLGCEKKQSESLAPAASASAAGAPASSTSANAAPLKPRAQAARHGGVASALFHGANDLPDLTPAEQVSLIKLESDLKSDDDSIRAAMKTFRSDLEAGIRANKLDSTKLTADEGAIDKVIAGHQSKEAQALESLHGLLTAPQRTALVSTVRGRQAKRESRATAWLSAKEGDGGAVDWNARRLDKLTEDLALDAGQQKQVAAILTKGIDAPDGKTMQSRWEERKKRAEAVLTALAADAMDTKRLDLSVLPGKSPHEPMDHIVAFYAKLLPILHPDQRDKLAASLDRPFGGHGGMRGHHGDRSAADDMAFPFAEPIENPDEETSPE